MRSRGVAVGLSALLIASGTYGVWIDKTTLEKTQWREVAHYLRMHAEQDDIIITTERYCLRSYEPDLARITVTAPRSHEEPDLQMLLSRQLSTASRVWVVRSDPDAHVAEYLSTEGSHVKTWEHGWIKLHVSLWRKRSERSSRMHDPHASVSLCSEQRHANGCREAAMLRWPHCGGLSVTGLPEAPETDLRELTISRFLALAGMALSAGDKKAVSRATRIGTGKRWKSCSRCLPIATNAAAC